MDKQFKIYSVDTKSFYTNKENKLNSKRFKIKKQIDIMESWALYKINNEDSDISYEEYKNKFYKLEYLKKIKEKTPTQEVELKELKDMFKITKAKVLKDKQTYKTAQEIEFEKGLLEAKIKKSNRELIKEYLDGNIKYSILKKIYRDINSRLNERMKKSNIRRLNPKTLNEYNQITLFENALSRAMEIEENEMNMDMIVVRAYHYEILKQLIENGFEYIDSDGVVNHYRVFTASAGQIRTKKVIFIKDEQWTKYEKTLMCGLTLDSINVSKEQGCNINKFLAYLALCNSATDEIEGFDIDRCVVIEDFETMVNGEVDYIDNKTFKVKRKTLDIPIPHSDGCGWINPKVSKKNFMIRLPWVKGLMTPVNYIDFCDEFNNGNCKVTDIYGKEYDLKEDNIDYVFTKSQFKMWKYYSSWDEYKENFKKYGCMGNMCNLEPDTKEFRKASFNYQMWQTLVDITDEEIKSFTDIVDEYITKGYSDRKTMLNLLGADSDNVKKNGMQKCLEIYPELLRDYHVKEELASILNARKKEAKYGKFKIEAMYTFLIPDVFAWMQNVFLAIETPQGILKEGEVYCRLYKDSNKLLVNRSPHLYREHAVRDNNVNDDTKKWFITDGVYTSSHDLISKILQFDNDGDKGLVVADERLIPIAERNMKNVVPLYYEMGKAKAEIINESNIYTSLTKAFSFNNIGKFSNKLTVMWNLDDANDKLKTIAQITALNNFTIDGAKTLLVPKVPSDVEEKMKESNGKLPYFFQFAKDKNEEDVAPINNSTVNRICRNIENIKRCNYDFKSLGRFKYTMLMGNKDIEINNNIINTYNELEKLKKDFYTKANILGLINEEGVKTSYNSYMYNKFREVCGKESVLMKDAVDMLIKYIYATNRNGKKSFLFEIFGEYIFKSLDKNIISKLSEGYIMCDECGKRVKKTSNNSNIKYCSKCAKHVKLVQNSKSYYKNKY